MKEFLKMAWEMGGQILAGTDNGPYFDELEAYAEAGLPTTAVLQTATTNGAKWLGKEKDFGTVEAGKRANLVLVEGDPLKNIKDLRTIAVVIKDGRIVFRK
jgi:imidazolonepropionase-like amidohydrolase